MRSKDGEGGWFRRKKIKTGWGAAVFCLCFLPAAVRKKLKPELGFGREGATTVLGEKNNPNRVGAAP